MVTCVFSNGTGGQAAIWYWVRRVLGQHLAQVVLVDDQQPVEDLPAQGNDDGSAQIPDG